MGLNLSEWALKHRSFVVYLMLASSLAGAAASYQLGRDEDPPFTVRTMVVAARWPGATIDETLQQVTERLERSLQETPHLDFLRSFTRPGVTTIFVNLVGATTGTQVEDTWYQVRKSIGDMRHTLPPGVVGPFFDDDFGDVFGIIYGLTADGFSQRELRDYAESIRSKLLQVPDVAKIEMLGTQDETIFIEFSTRQLAGLGLDQSVFVDALRAQNLILPSGTIQTGAETLALRVTGTFDSEEDIRNVNFVANGRTIRLRDIAQVHRGHADPPQPIFRVNGKNGIGLAVSMREGGDILTLGRNLDAAMRTITADLPIGIEPTLVANQPVVVEHHQRVPRIAVAGDRHHHGRELHQPRRAPRHGRGAVDPSDDRHHVPDHGTPAHRSPAHLARRAHHRTHPARRRRHDDDRRHDRAPGRGG
jgi:multidrug efflux pump subunit AcrB